MPINDKTPVKLETITKESWAIENIDVILDVKPLPFPIPNFNPEQLIKEKLFGESEGIVLCFTSKSDEIYDESDENFTSRGNVYSIKNDELLEESEFEIKENALHLDNPNLIGRHYIPKFYITRKNPDDLTKLVIYLNKEEAMELIDKDGSVSSGEKTLINMYVNDAQFEIHLVKSDIDYSHLYENK
jgi:hypothetical protein